MRQFLVDLIEEVVIPASFGIVALNAVKPYGDSAQAMMFGIIGVCCAIFYLYRHRND